MSQSTSADAIPTPARDAVLADFDGHLLLVGAGKMGGAMLEGWLAGGLPPGKVLVQDPAPPSDIAAHLERAGITAHAEAAEALAAQSAEATAPFPTVAVIAVKPQLMAPVFPAVAQHLSPGTLIVSVAAGTPLSFFESHAAPNSAVVRAMPNTPAAVGRGITICCPNAHTNATQRATATALLAAVGQVGWIEDEAQMDAVTGVSGSGPAYVFHLVECMAAAGVAAGLDAPLAEQLARATVAGAGELLHRSDETATTLRENVTSPQGTTAAALDVLMGDERLERLMREAVAAAAARGRALG
ncbi:MAG: pyrroline-5-carboxylate reductase [Pseudomonadota bacterium]